MVKIDGFYLYSLGFSIHAIADLKPDAPFSECWLPLYVAHDAVNGFLNQSVYQLKVSQPAGKKLYGILNDLVSNPTRKNNLTFYEQYQIQSALSEFEHVLAAEFGMLNMWLVRKKRGYDANDLIQNGWVLFPPELPGKVPECLPDVIAATQCIAFTLATAAGFHLHRANEAVLHRYYDAVTNGASRPSGRNIGDYLTALEKHSGRSKVTSSLKDLKDLHRNPLIHPEESMDSIDDAVALLGSVHACITLMLKEIPSPQQDEEIPTDTSAVNDAP